MRKHSFHVASIRTRKADTAQKVENNESIVMNTDT